MKIVCCGTPLTILEIKGGCNSPFIIGVTDLEERALWVCEYKGQDLVGVQVGPPLDILQAV